MDTSYCTYEQMVEHGFPPVDVSGIPVHLWDTVEYLDDNYTTGPIGLIGTVVGFHAPKGIAILFPGYNQGHHCIGLLAPNSKGGEWALIGRVKVIPAEIDDREEDFIRTATEAIVKESQVLLIDGKAFNVTLAENKIATDPLTTLMVRTGEKIRAIRTEASQRVKAVEDKAKQELLIPAITLRHVQAGMQIYKDSTRIAYLVPFVYAPVRLEWSKHPRKKATLISDEDAKKLKTNLILSIWVNNRGRIDDLTLLHNWCPFKHYHTHCTGSMPLPIIKTPNNIFTFRDKYQHLLEAVNMDSLASNYCHSIASDELVERAREFNQAVDQAWSSQEKEATKDQIHKGDIVKVIRGCEGFPANYIGSIGKALEEDDREFLFVEFLFSSSAFHDCCGLTIPNHGYTFPIADLERMPVGTQRTRNAGIADRTTPNIAATLTTSTQPATGWTTTELAMPRPLIVHPFNPSFAVPDGMSESVAKFGVEYNGDYTISCARCGTSRGSHFLGSDGGAEVCPDEYSAGRRPR